MSIRSEIISEAITWMGTPWKHEASVKRCGVDCAKFLIAVYSAVGLIERITIPHYPIDWHLHKNEPKFLNTLLEYCEKVDEPLPGDIAMFRFGRHAAHGSIVIKWPVIIHAFRDEGCVIQTNVEQSNIADRLVGFYRLKGLEDGRSI